MKIQSVEQSRKFIKFTRRYACLLQSDVSNIVLDMVIKCCLIDNFDFYSPELV